MHCLPVGNDSASLHVLDTAPDAIDNSQLSINKAGNRFAREERLG